MKRLLIGLVLLPAMAGAQLRPINTAHPYGFDAVAQVQHVYMDGAMRTGDRVLCTVSIPDAATSVERVITQYFPYDSWRNLASVGNGPGLRQEVWILDSATAGGYAPIFDFQLVGTRVSTVMAVCYEYTSGTIGAIASNSGKGANWSVSIPGAGDVYCGAATPQVDSFTLLEGLGHYWFNSYGSTGMDQASAEEVYSSDGGCAGSIYPYGRRAKAPAWTAIALALD